jgi:DUF971 family protein
MPEYTDSLERRRLESLPPGARDPKAVKVHLTAGTGVDIEWKDNHLSHYSFPYLRDACPCAMCDDERGKEDPPRNPWEPKRTKPGGLPMFKPAAKPTEVSPVGKYAMKFTWNDGHETGIYSWDFLRLICPCTECGAQRAGMMEPGERMRTTPH